MENLKESVKRIEYLYSKDRLDVSKKRLETVWNREYLADRIPFVFTDYLEGLNDSFNWNDYYEAKYDYKTHLYFGIKLIENHSFLNDDYIPAVSPGCRQALIPSMFGTREILGDYHFWVEPLGKSIDEVCNIIPIKPEKSQVFKDTLNRILYFIDFLKDSIISIHIPDLQTPLDIASMIMGTENLIIAMVDKPEKVHILMNNIVNTLIQAVDFLIKASSNFLTPFHPEPTVWVPKGKGISFSEDLLAVLSPKLYEEFGIPYNNILSGKFGGFFTHSCGRFTQNLSNLLKIDNFIGINFQVTEQDLYKTLEVLQNKAFLVCGWADTVKYINWSPEEHIKNSFEAVKKYKTPSVIMIPAFFESQDFENPGKDRMIELNRLALENSIIY